jgi:vacuolar-type H+-ATPase subunit H
MYNMTMTDTIDDATKKVKDAEQDVRAKAETTEDHAEGKPSSETLNKAKEKIKDTFS